jgi:hypothetical protein
MRLEGIEEPEGIPVAACRKFFVSASFVSAGVPPVQTDPVSLVPNTVAFGVCGP